MAGNKEFENPGQRGRDVQWRPNRGEKQQKFFESFVLDLEYASSNHSSRVTWSSVHCYFRFECLIQADKPTLIGYCGHPHFDHLVSRLLLAISRSIRSKTQNAKTSHSRFDQLCEISFWKNKKKWKDFSRIGKSVTCHWSGKPSWMTNYQKFPDGDLKMVSYFRREIRTGRVWGQ